LSFHRGSKFDFIDAVKRPGLWSGSGAIHESPKAIEGHTPAHNEYHREAPAMTRTTWQKGKETSLVFNPHSLSTLFL